MAKIRTQVQLERRQYDRLKRLAATTGKSLSAVVRELVDRGLSDSGTVEDTREARLRFIGSGRDPEGKRDVARNHDRYLYGGRG